MNRTVGETLRDMGRIGEADHLEWSHGFDRGNYTSVYKTTDYHKAVKSLVGINGFTRVGFLLGFFSSFEIQEVPTDIRAELSHYREVARLLDMPGGAP